MAIRNGGLVQNEPQEKIKRLESRVAALERNVEALLQPKRFAIIGGIPVVRADQQEATND